MLDESVTGLIPQTSPDKAVFKAKVGKTIYIYGPLEPARGAMTEIKTVTGDTWRHIDSSRYKALLDWEIVKLYNFTNIDHTIQRVK